jgi:membrane dipeptidase
VLDAMRWIDGHLDLAYAALCGRDLGVPCPDPAAGCVSLPELREAGVGLALATIFTEPGVTDSSQLFGYVSSEDLDGAERAGRRQLDIYHRLEAGRAVGIVRSRGGLGVRAGGPEPRIVLLMEGADPIRSPQDAGWWYDSGVRAVGLAWAAGTRYAGGNRNPGPLTPLGVDLVRALDELGMIHDASHLADEAFEGLLATADGPIVATHSNCRALAGASQRHLSDEQIAGIGKRGGIVGLNLFGKFLVPGGRAAISDCVAHVERVCGIMGHRRGVGLGSDMDGGFPPSALPPGLDHPRKLEALAEALRNAGWPDEDIEGFRHANWFRFLERALPA